MKGVKSLLKESTREQELDIFMKKIEVTREALDLKKQLLSLYLSRDQDSAGQAQLECSRESPESPRETASRPCSSFSCEIEQPQAFITATEQCPSFMREQCSPFKQQPNQLQLMKATPNFSQLTSKFLAQPKEKQQQLEQTNKMSFGMVFQEDVGQAQIPIEQVVFEQLESKQITMEPEPIDSQVATPLKRDYFTNQEVKQPLKPSEQIVNDNGESQEQKLKFQRKIKSLQRKRQQRLKQNQKVQKSTLNMQSKQCQMTFCKREPESAKKPLMPPRAGQEGKTQECFWQQNSEHSKFFQQEEQELLAQPSAPLMKRKSREKEKEERSTISQSPHLEQRKSAIIAKPSNHKLMINAVKYLLPGQINKADRERYIALLEAHTEEHIVFLLKEPSRLAIKGCYRLAGKKLNKLWGTCPEQLEEVEVSHIYRYDSGARQFRLLEGCRHFSLAINGVVIK